MGLRYITEKHHYPDWLIRNPHWIFGHYFLLHILFQRSRVCHKALRKLLKEKSVARILDAGCGEGQYLIPSARKYPDKQFTGIDILKDHIDFLNTLKRRQGFSNCTFQPEGITRHLTENPGYNLIFIIGVLQYSPDPELIIKNACRSQSRGDYLFLYSPVQEGVEFAFYRYFRNKFGHYDDAQNYHRPLRSSELLSWVKDAGYSIEERQSHYGFAGALGHQIMQSILMMMTHWKGVGKVLAVLIFIIFMPIFVPLQWVDPWMGTENRDRFNGLLLILQKL